MLSVLDFVHTASMLSVRHFLFLGEGAAEVAVVFSGDGERSGAPSGRRRPLGQMLGFQLAQSVERQALNLIKK